MKQKTHPLKVWRVLNGDLSQDEVGHKIKRSGVAVGRYEAGAIPDPATMGRIFLLTLGQVGPADFYKLPAIPAGRKQKEPKQRGK